jgi:hypothetical protein
LRWAAKGSSKTCKIKVLTSHTLQLCWLFFAEMLQKVSAHSVQLILR